MMDVCKRKNHSTIHILVRMKGLEPSRREAHAPKACVSTNSTTSAYSIVKDTPAYLLMTHITHAVTTSMQLTAKGAP